jgi:sodium/bile acid cotransporter 7
MIAPALFLAACTPRNSELTGEEKRARIREMTGETREEFPAVPQIDVDSFLKMRAAGGVVLVDVRGADERAISGIPGAIAREEFEQHKAEYARRPIVAYCTIGYRSSRYVETLRAEGLDASNLEGSILAWVQAGQPVVDPDGQPTRRVHTFGKKWSLLPDGYDAVY